MRRPLYSLCLMILLATVTKFVEKANISVYWLLRDLEHCARLLFSSFSSEEATRSLDSFA